MRTDRVIHFPCTNPHSLFFSTSFFFFSLTLTQLRGGFNNMLCKNSSFWETTDVTDSMTFKIESSCSASCVDPFLRGTTFCVLYGAIKNFETFYFLVFFFFCDNFLKKHFLLLLARLFSAELGKNKICECFVK